MPINSVAELLNARQYIDTYYPLIHGDDPHHLGQQAHLRMQELNATEGVEILRARCDAAGVEFNCQWLKQQRGIVAQRPGMTPAAVDVMSVAEFAGLLTSDEKTDKKTDKQEKTLPPHDVNDCARYIAQQRELIAQGKRPKATKNALIAEYLGHDDTDAMARQLQPSRFGWLLEVGRTTDK